MVPIGHDAQSITKFQSTPVRERGKGGAEGLPELNVTRHGMEHVVIEAKLKHYLAVRTVSFEVVARYDSLRIL